MPNLAKNYYLNFYGGEPLLCYNLIKKTISFLNNKNKEFRKKAKYSITTNGSLFTEEIVQFLNKHKFSVELSFDGLAQNLQRKKGSFKKTVSTINDLLKCSKIDLEINSVFTPETIDYLSESIEFLIDLAVPNIHFSLSIIKPWNQASILKLEKEMTKLRKIMLAHCRRKRNIPVINFRADSGKGIFYCAAGKDRLAVSPEGQIWGCYLFPDFFRGKEDTAEYQKFSFGDLDNFIENHKKIYPRVSSNYAQLSMDNFSTPHLDCLFCSELDKCAVCPVNAAFSGSSLAKIPAYACEIQKIKIKEKEKFRKEYLKMLQK